MGFIFHVENNDFIEKLGIPEEVKMSPPTPPISKDLFFIVSASRSPPGLGSDTASRSPPGLGHRFAQSAVSWKYVVFTAFVPPFCTFM